MSIQEAGPVGVGAVVFVGSVIVVLGLFLLAFRPHLKGWSDQDRNIPTPPYGS